MLNLKNDDIEVNTNINEIVNLEGASNMDYQYNNIIEDKNFLNFKKMLFADKQRLISQKILAKQQKELSFNKWLKDRKNKENAFLKYNNRKILLDKINTHFYKIRNINTYNYNYKSLSIEQLSYFKSSKIYLNSDYLNWRKKIAVSSNKFYKININNWLKFKNNQHLTKTTHFFTTLFLQNDKEVIEQAFSNTIFPLSLNTTNLSKNSNIIDNLQDFNNKNKKGRKASIKNLYLWQFKQFCQNFNESEFGLNSSKFLFMPFENLPHLDNMIYDCLKWNYLDAMQKQQAIQLLNEKTEQTLDLLDNNEYRIPYKEFNYSPLSNIKMLRKLFKLPSKIIIDNLDPQNLWHLEYSKSEFEILLENEPSIKEQLKIVNLLLFTINLKYQNNRYINLNYLNKKLVELFLNKIISVFDILCIARVIRCASKEELKLLGIYNEVHNNAGRVLLVMLHQFENNIKNNAILFDAEGLQEITEQLELLNINTEEINKICDKYGFYREANFSNQQVGKIYTKVRLLLSNKNIIDDSLINFEVSQILKYYIKLGVTLKGFEIVCEYINNKGLYFAKHSYSKYNYFFKIIDGRLKHLQQIDPILKTKINLFYEQLANFRNELYNNQNSENIENDVED